MSPRPNSSTVDWTPLHAQLHQLLRQRQLLEKHQPILVAVSGGQDSLCLLKLLLDLQPKWHWSLGVAHCDHRWPPDSSANAAHVAQMAQQWQLPYFSRTAPQVLKREAEGRNWRYQVLAEIAQAQGYPTVVTAHTASDRAETLLFNLMRGSGTDGLTALKWRRPLTTDVDLVRPLLAVTRSVTGNFCQTLGLPVWEDQMNRDLSYRRNRIRCELLPYLREHFNPQVDVTLAHTAELLAAEVAYLDAAANTLLQSAQPDPNEDCILNPSAEIIAQLARSRLQNQPLALQRRAIYQFLQTTLEVAPNYDQVDKVMALITAPNRTRTDPLKGPFIAEAMGDWLRIVRLPGPA